MAKEDKRAFPRPRVDLRRTAAIFTGTWISFLMLWAIIASDVRASDLDDRISIHDGFVDEKTCASCHPAQAAAFATSHHAKAMSLANDKTVLGDFIDSRFEQHDVSAAFFRRANQYIVRTEGADGKEAEFEVKYTFGVEPLQQYMAELGGGKLQVLDVAWNTEKQQWLWLGEGTAAKPGSTFHWTGPFYRWNRTCIDCHSTDPKTNFQPQKMEYNSSYVATSIGCQSCHGGGATHVEWAKGKPTTVVRQSTPSAGLAEVSTDTCFACHARRTRLVESYRPGGAFLDSFAPALLQNSLYFPDGQIREEVFEFGSFQQSKMARAGVTCLDCHTTHEGRLKAVGNALCTQCHTEGTSVRFAHNKPNGTYDTPAHTHHPEGSTGALCANCHMPERTYMKVDPRRDHSFVIPRPDISELYGTPNACTSCHEGKTNAWASGNMDRWYGDSWRKRPTIAHAFARAAQDDRASIEALRKLVLDREQGGFVRGSAVAEMSRLGGAKVVADLRTAARDGDPLVRVGAAEAATNLPPPDRIDFIGTLLEDETRAVRVAAAKALGPTQRWHLPEDQRRAFDDAVADLRAYVQANADVAETQSTYGIFSLEQGDVNEAERALRLAAELDPDLAGVRINLAELYRSTGRGEKSEQTYADAVAAIPDRADLRYGHGLSLVRQKAMEEAINELEMAVRLDPANPQYRVTAAIALDSVARTDDALALLDLSIATGAADANLLNTAIQMGLKLRRYSATLTYAQELARLQPRNQQIAELVRELAAAVELGR